MRRNLKQLISKQGSRFSKYVFISYYVKNYAKSLASYTLLSRVIWYRNKDT